MTNSSSPTKRFTKSKDSKELFTALFLGLFLFLLLLVMGSIFSAFPKPVTLNRFITVFSLSLLIGVTSFWNRLRPNVIATFLCGMGITGLMLAWAIHNLMFGIVGTVFWVWLLPLVAAYIIAWLLPVLDPSLAKTIDNEQFAPKTKLGRGCMIFGLSIGGAAGALGASIARYLGRSGDFQTAFLILGIGVSIATIALSQTMSYQTYTKLIREKKSKQNSRKEESE